MTPEEVTASLREASHEIGMAQADELMAAFKTMTEAEVLAILRSLMIGRTLSLFKEDLSIWALDRVVEAKEAENE